MKMQISISAVRHRESRLPRANASRYSRHADPSPGQSVSRCGAVAQSAVITDGGDTQRTCAAGLTAL
ncbi:MAG: hypothetical protein LJE69_01750 [Thiohalocapsa sp.]|jgi:hypothetical protein|uniref:hypothetical protein n=1 Tax=Thiohalocapsa sp. TaxID=2497641 RepID=UPI0025D55A54|nr:hypothetical protein [Thiohalocapsa sp.]MCG6939960.1 hypothetical protein [Thiohalocapsa sp.]